jgi:hypothetical protein
MMSAAAALGVNRTPDVHRISGATFGRTVVGTGKNGRNQRLSGGPTKVGL